MSSSRPFCRVVAFALFALLLAACGNKGPLVKPSAEPAAASPPALPAATPAIDADGH